MIEYTVKVYPSGSKEWRLNNKLHREDGPAIECANGYKSWYRNGELHCEDGPAIVDIEGTKFWFLHGIRLDEEEFLRKTNPSPELQVIKDLRKVAEKHGYKLIKEGE